MRETPHPRAPSGSERPRPTLDVGGGDAPAREFVAGLEAALAAGDADDFNDAFAEDVLWGSPFGAVVAGYAEIHAVHAAMIAPPAAGASLSHYEVETARRVSEDVALAFVRRTSSGPRGPESPGRTDAFDELALFVLVRRDDRWWLAAGLHTPDRRDVYDR